MCRGLLENRPLSCKHYGSPHSEEQTNAYKHVLSNELMQHVGKQLTTHKHTAQIYPNVP